MYKVRSKLLLINCILFLGTSHVFSLDFNIRLTPQILIPVGESSSLFKVGGGASLNTDLEFFNMMYVGPEFGYFITPLLGTTTNAQLISGGLGSGVFFYPFSRLKVQCGVAGGAYEMLASKSSYSDLWWKIYADAGFRISPSFVVSAGAGYTSFCNNTGTEPLYTGITGGLSAQVSFDTVTASGNVDATLSQGEPVFPLFYGIYKENSIGTLKIVNNESAEIRNVSVSFRAGNYTSSLMPCGTSESILKRKSVEIPLYADFSDTILNFTENGKMPGELIIDYELLGAKRKVSKTLIIPVYNRNIVRWTDTAVLASFISPKAPEVLDYSKFMVGMARDKLRSGLNRNMQFAMYLFEGLKIGGLSYSQDETTPYHEYHKNPELLDYVQYPFQTLAYHSGDYDDLGILYAAALESAGIRAAIIPLDDDFIVAFSLGISAADAESLFNGTENLLTIADEIWIPLSFSVLREGYINSWYNAMDTLNAAFASGTEPDFVILQEAWKTYPAASFQGSEATFAKPLEESVVRAVEADLLRYVSTEFGPKILAVQDDIRTGGGSAQLYNQLGVLYVRAGMYAEAKAEYKKSAALKSASAMVNLGNIAVIERDYKSARVWYSKALEIQPENKAAFKGLERANLELAQ